MTNEDREVFMTEGEGKAREEAYVRMALQRYMILLIQKHREEGDTLVRELLSAEIMELDDWYCSLANDEGVSLMAMAQKKIQWTQ